MLSSRQDLLCTEFTTLAKDGRKARLLSTMSTACSILEISITSFFWTPLDIWYTILSYTALLCKFSIFLNHHLFFFCSQAQGTLAYQTYIHHLLGFTGFYLTLYTEGIPVIFGVMSLSLEASTIFLNLRWFTFEFKVKGTTIPLINSTMLFLAYFFARMIFQTYISFWLAYPNFYKTWILSTSDDIIKLGKDPLAFRAAGAFMLVTNVLSQIINYHWFGLIMKQVYRNIAKALG